MITITLSIFGVFLIFYLVMEFGFYFYTKCTLIQMLLLNIGLKGRIEKVIPPWWEVVEGTELCGINRPFLKYRVWVRFKVKSSNEYLSDWVLLDRLGRVEDAHILRDRLYNSAKATDSDKVIYSREKLLNDLGI
jgi:hypothetical protein